MRARPLGVLVIATIACVLVSAQARAQISVVANPDVTATLTPSQAAEIFGGTVRVWPSGAKIYVADQSETGVGREFYETVLKQSPSVVRLHWVQLILSGQAVAPRRMTGDAAVLEFVRRTPGAIGYVRSAAVDGSVTELLKVPAPPRAP